MRKRIGYQSTLQVIQGLRAYFDPEYLKMPYILKVIPAEMLEWFKSPEGKWFKKRNWMMTMRRTQRCVKAFDNGPVRRVRQVAGVPGQQRCNFLFSKDTPSISTYGNLPGLNGYLEMQQLREAGLLSNRSTELPP